MKNSKLLFNVGDAVWTVDFENTKPVKCPSCCGMPTIKKWYKKKVITYICSVCHGFGKVTYNKYVVRKSFISKIEIDDGVWVYRADNGVTHFSSSNINECMIFGVREYAEAAASDLNNREIPIAYPYKKK